MQRAGSGYRRRRRIAYAFIHGYNLAVLSYVRVFERILIFNMDSQYCLLSIVDFVGSQV